MLKKGDKVKDINKYNSIIKLSYCKSKKHPQMSMQDRAAQFSPFAALTGHETAIKETARLTQRKIELDESEKEELDYKINIISQNISKNQHVKIMYFTKDLKKSGGEYLQFEGEIKKIDYYKRNIFAKDGTVIPIDDILKIDI